MKRILIICICVLLTIPWLMAWTDVPASAWYAEAADWCEAEGLMCMADGDAFGPKEAVTRGQLLHEIACVLTYLLNGSAELSPAPDDWGTAVVTFGGDSGTVTFFAWDRTSWRYWNGPMGKEPMHYTLKASAEEVIGFFPNLTEGQSDFCDAQIDFGDKLVVGRLCGTMHSDLEGGEAAFLFYPKVTSEYENAGMFDSGSPSALFSVALPLGPDYRDGVYYLAKLGIAFGTSLDAPAPRWYMAELLYHISQYESLPEEFFQARCSSVPPTDSDYAEWLSPLYRAGIINGMDAEGNFDPYETVTRAQLSMVLYRVADVNHRCA